MAHSVVNKRYGWGKGFTLVELIVAVSIIAIFAVLVSLQLQAARRNSRDSRRLSDVHTYVGALTQYQLTAGNTFVTNTTGNCTLQTGTGGDITGATGSDCTGVGGLGYGKINLTQATVSSFDDTNRQYTSISIAKALEARGYVTSIGKDPFSSDSSTDATQPDYYLVRCCSNNSKQNRSTTGQAFAVWTILERTPTLQEVENTKKSCGSKVLEPNGNSVYDFGITDTSTGSAERAALEARGVAISNAALGPISDAPCCTSTNVALGN